MTTMPYMNAFALRCHIASEAKGWTNLKRTDAQTINLMVSENSEALEDFRNKRGITEIYYELKTSAGIATYTWEERADAPKGHVLKPCGIPIEIADTIIRIGQQCGTHKLDLASAMERVGGMVKRREDLNEALADSTLFLSAAWYNSKQYNGGSSMGGPVPMEDCFAKALWSLLYFCESAGIDVWKAIEEKMAYNDTRPMLHGGKAI